MTYSAKCANIEYHDLLTKSRTGNRLTQEEINFIKNEVALAVERKKYLTPLITITNKEIDKLKTYFKPNEKNYLLYNKKDLLLEDKILRLGKLFLTCHYFQVFFKTAVKHEYDILVWRNILLFKAILFEWNLFI